MRWESGWWVPDNMVGLPTYMARSDSLLLVVEDRASRREVVIQAGGHIGFVPYWLAGNFEAVYTFEPHRENFACLVRNMDLLGNVFPARGILGDKRGTVGLAIHSRNSGAHNVEGPGPVPTYRIDDLGLTNCDAILLDVEGYEVHALRGALATIKRCKPLIIAEENKKAHGKGFKPGDIESLLAPFGYALLDRVGEDLVLGVA